MVLEQGKDDLYHSKTNSNNAGKRKTAPCWQLSIANLTSNKRGISKRQFGFEERGHAKICCISPQCILLAQQPEPKTLILTSSPLHRGSAPRPLLLPKGPH
jgi:hypothetical protein